MNPIKIFQNANINNNKCIFCNPTPGMIIHETANFRLLRVNFPASIGHLMISSKLHFGSMGELDSNLFSELKELKSTVTLWFKKHLQYIIFYEHGKAGGCFIAEEAGTQCEHFHLNFLPLDICIHQDLKKIYSPILINNLEDIVNIFDTFGEYLYFENNQGEKIFYSVKDKKIKPHFLRSIICKKNNMPHKANWQKHQNYEDFLDSYNLTKPLEDDLKNARIS